MVWYLFLQGTIIICWTDVKGTDTCNAKDTLTCLSCISFFHNLSMWLLHGYKSLVFSRTNYTMYESLISGKFWQIQCAHMMTYHTLIISQNLQCTYYNERRKVLQPLEYATVLTGERDEIWKSKYRGRAWNIF